MNTFGNMQLLPSNFNFQTSQIPQSLFGMPLFPSFNNQNFNFSNLQNLQKLNKNTNVIASLETDTTLEIVKKVKTEVENDNKSFYLNDMKGYVKQEEQEGSKQEAVVRSNSTSVSLSEIGVQDLPKIEEDSCDPLEVDKKLTSQRKSYANFFKETRKNMLQCWQKQIEFLKMLEELNQPENVLLWPVLDQINPLLSGVMNQKANMDKNTLTVLKRALRLMKSGPNYRSTNTNKKALNKDKATNKNLDEDVFKPTPINGKRVLKESEALSKNNSPKLVQNNRENNGMQSLEQIMDFIIKGKEY